MMASFAAHCNSAIGQMYAFASTHCPIEIIHKFVATTQQTVIVIEHSTRAVENISRQCPSGNSCGCVKKNPKNCVKHKLFAKLY